RAWLASVLLLSACAKDAGKALSSASHTDPGFAFSRLDHTEKFSEEELISAAASAASGGVTLPASLANRCWEAESARPRVREACALAWSAAGESSPAMEANLKSALSSRVIAIAAARRASLVHSLSDSELITLLHALALEAPWIRALVARTWLESRHPADLGGWVAVLNALALPAEAPDPLTAGAGYAAARSLGLPAAESAITSYCPAGGSGPVLTRCLRFLSALADPRTGGGLDPLARSFLPQHNDPGAILFRRSFPDRSRLLETYY
ncbi:MAG: hypothetical protein ACXWP1_10075, partial [Bdellovibrionota bacterium]